MNEDIQKDLRKYVYTLLLFVVLLLILAVSQYFLGPSYQAGLKHSVQKTLNALPNTSITLGPGMQINTTGITHISAWPVLEKKHQKEIIIAMAVTGDLGPQTAIFHWIPGENTRFRCIVGLPESSMDPGRFGLTDRLINYRTKKINALINSRENSK